jgi:hypothetical protein
VPDSPINVNKNKVSCAGSEVPPEAI